MRRSDAAAVNIFHDLKSHFLASAQEYGPAGTVIGLFFHDLMVHFTSILIHRDAQNSYGEGFIRLSYANSIENINIAIDRLNNMVNSL